MCHKKAAKFGAWLSNTEQPNYVLLTDWREAKPCMDIISSSCKFIRMIVFCEMETTFRKAIEWVRHLPIEAGPVYVASTIEEVDAYLLESFAQDSQVHLEMSTTASSPSELDSDWQGMGVDADTRDQSGDELRRPGAFVSLASAVEHVWIPYEPMTSAPVHSMASAVEHIWLSCEHVPSATVEHSMTLIPHELDMHSGTDMPPPMVSAENPMLHVLGLDLSSYTAQDLNRALEDAMPDCYTD